MFLAKGREKIKKKKRRSYALIERLKKSIKITSVEQTKSFFYDIKPFNKGFQVDFFGLGNFLNFFSHFPLEREIEAIEEIKRLSRFNSENGYLLINGLILYANIGLMVL